MIAVGGFDTATWRSTGISYSVKVSSDAPADQLAHLLKAVDQVAEIPQAIRAGASVQRAGLTIPYAPEAVGPHRATLTSRHNSVFPRKRL